MLVHVSMYQVPFWAPIFDPLPHRVWLCWKTMLQQLAATCKSGLSSVLLVAKTTCALIKRPSFLGIRGFLMKQMGCLTTLTRGPIQRAGQFRWIPLCLQLLFSAISNHLPWVSGGFLERIKKQPEETWVAVTPLKISIGPKGVQCQKQIRFGSSLRARSAGDA